MNAFRAGGSHIEQGQTLEQALQRAGFYPLLVGDVIEEALDGSPCIAHLAHLETHFDQTEVHRHITVLALTEELLIIAHVDDQQLDEQGEHVVAQISTETVPVRQIRSVVLNYLYTQPQDYKPSDPVRELTLSIGWSGGQRLDIGPAACGDPQCEADHGYTGTITHEDIALRISAEADGLIAVQDAKIFARALRSANSRALAAGSSAELSPSRSETTGRGSRFGRSQHR
ncbi:DUF5998 family protein [Psychromicrobium lacuslunae]|nr:DUF5998 family protein [Psychromicrobium lacuslunae]